MQSTVEEVFHSLQRKVPELRAVILVSAAGELKFHALPGLDFDPESFAAEYATLFRIALRTTQDTAMGQTVEQILISDKAILVVRRYGPDDVAVFVCGPDSQLGRLRYEIRCIVESLSDSVS